MAVADTPAEPPVGLSTGTTQVYRLNKHNKWRVVGSWLGGVAMALSGDGNVVAVSSSPLNVTASASYLGNGTVTVYRFHANRWTQLGRVLQGGFSFGAAVALSYNGTIVAVGESAYLPDPNRGRVVVYQWNYSSNDWELLGDPIVCQRTSFNGNGFGTAVAISADGDIVAASAPDYDEDANATLEYGILQVFWYNSSSSSNSSSSGGGWVQLGDDITSINSTYGITGNSIAMSSSSVNGLRIAAGLYFSTPTWFEIPYLVVYEYDAKRQEWSVVGTGVDGTGDQVTMSADGSTVAGVGKYYPVMYSSVSLYNIARVYQITTTTVNETITYASIGHDILYAHKVALSGDGTLLAVITTVANLTNSHFNIQVYRVL